MLPVIILSTNTILFSNCSVCDGVNFYPVLTLPAIILGIYVGFLRNKYQLTFIRVIIPLLFFLFFAAESVYELYSYPQMKFYNHIIGYFPGTIYDELITIDSKLLLHQFLTILTVLLSYMVVRKRTNKNISLILTISLFFLLFLMKPLLGLTSTLDSTKDSLGGELKTEHTTIIYDSTITKNEIEYIASLHEFYLDVLCDKLNISVPQGIISIIYRDSEQKKELFGASNADVAKPWFKQIYITESSVENTLKHELAHILMGRYGNPPLYLGANFDPFLIEGFASALEDNFEDYSVDYPAKLAYDNDFKFDADNLSSFNFFGQNSSISYSYAGSFAKFIMSKYDAERVLEIYSSGRLENVGASSEDIVDSYKNYLTKLPDLEFKDLSQYYFGYAPTYKKSCLRSTARKIYYGKIEFRNKRIKSALKYFTEAFEESKSFSALIGIIRCLNEQKKYDSAINKLVDNRFYFKNSRWEIPSLYFLAQEYYLSKKYDDALFYFDSLNNYTLPDNYEVSSKIFIESINDSVNLWGDDSLTIYRYLLNKVKREKNALFLIPLMNYDVNNDSLLKDIITNFAQNISHFKNISQYLLLNLSRKITKIGMYDEAYKMLSFAIENNKDYFRENVFREERRKVLWLKKQLK